MQCSIPFMPYTVVFHYMLHPWSPNSELVGPRDPCWLVTALTLISFDSHLQIFLWRKHLYAALSSMWFKGNDSLFAPGLNSDWLWHGAWLKGACVYDSIRPMRCMETFTRAYERETSVFHGTVWPLWLLFVNMRAACPSVKVIHLEGKSLENFWGWMQLCLRLALPPDFSFVNSFPVFFFSCFAFFFF